METLLNAETGIAKANAGVCGNQMAMKKGQYSLIQMGRGQGFCYIEAWGNGEVRGKFRLDRSAWVRKYGWLEKSSVIFQKAWAVRNSLIQKSLLGLPELQWWKLIRTRLIYRFPILIDRWWGVLEGVVRVAWLMRFWWSKSSKTAFDYRNAILILKQEKTTEDLAATDDSRRRSICFPLVKSKEYVMLKLTLSKRFHQ